MTIKKEFQRIILPIIKASPFLAVLVVLTIIIANQAVGYLPEQYQSEGAIKINNLNAHQTSFDLFQGNRSNASIKNENFLTEIEVLQSRDLIEKTIEQLDWELTIHRIGDMSHQELYKDRPFFIDYKILNPSFYDRELYIEYADDESFVLNSDLGQGTNNKIKFDSTLVTEHVELSISPNTDFLQARPNSLAVGDQFKFIINTPKEQTKQVKQNLFVRPVEKDIPIIRIYFEHEIALKAQEFVDQLMQTYMDESIFYKEKKSSETLAFLDDKLATAEDKLRKSESELAYFRTSNQLINTRQETEATLQELTQLDLQHIDFGMQKSELEKLYEYLKTGQSLLDFSPNFKALSNLIFQEPYLKVQNMEIERQDLLQKYMPQSAEIQNVDSKIEHIRVYIIESVQSALDNITMKQDRIQKSIDQFNQKIKSYPEKERALVVLNRAVTLNENMYTYLMEKRMELAISRSSDLYPHKIVNHANLPTSLSSPNRPLFVGLSVFLVLLFGIIITYIYDYFNAKIRSNDDVQEELDVPVIGTIWKNKNNALDSFDLVSSLLANVNKLPRTDDKGQLLVTTSMMSGEGKSFTCINLAKVLADTDKRVLIIDLDIRRPSIHTAFGVKNDHGLSALLRKEKAMNEIIINTDYYNLDVVPSGHLNGRSKALIFSARTNQFIEEMRHHYDVVIVDTPPIGIIPDAIPIMQNSTANLFVIRADYTKRHLISAMKHSIQSWNIPNLNLVMNSVKPSKQYIGYVGSREYAHSIFGGGSSIKNLLRKKNRK